MIRSPLSRGCPHCTRRHFLRAGAGAAALGAAALWLPGTANATGTVGPVNDGDAGNHFAARGFPAMAKSEFEVSMPALNFTWTSYPLETSGSSFALMGTEVNGTFYDQGMSPAALPPETRRYVRRLNEG